MTHVITRWFKTYFTDPEGVILAVLLVGGFAIVIFMGEMLAPLLASVVVAYLLEALVQWLQRRGIARSLSVYIVFALFLAVVGFIAFRLMPVMSIEITQLIQNKLPVMVDHVQQSLLTLPLQFPNFITEAQVRGLFAEIGGAISAIGQKILSVSMASISGVFTLLIYLVLVPVLVFFLLKDKQLLIDWLTGFLPRERGLATRVWREMDLQIGNYVRGKITEIIVVSVATYIAFAVMGLQYEIVLAFLVGLSVIVPYIGAIVVTVPVALIAYFQWGWSADFAYLMVSYTVIQVIDGYLLVPLLFSEAVNLHPIAIITAVLVFGGVWGFWGVFFAIPLATLVKAVFNAWPRSFESDLPS